MNKIIKLHGCSGAGKTTLARKVLAASDPVIEIMSRNGKKVEGYQLMLRDIEEPIFLLGPYNLNSGGVDSIDSAEKVMELVDEFYPEGHIIFEGLLYSTYYGKMGLHSLKYGPHYIYAFMDTPKEKCLERVIDRRARNGTTSKFDPTITEGKHDTILRVRKKVQGLGHTIIDLPGEGSGGFNILLNTLKG